MGCTTASALGAFSAKPLSIAKGRSAGLSTPHGPSSIAGRSKWLAVAGRTPLLVRAGGFGDSGSKRKEAAVQGNRKAQPTSRAPQTKQAGAGIAPPAPGGSTNVAGWTKCEISKAPGDLDIVPTILNNKGFVIINADDKLYAMEANCPSCKYPIVKGTVTSAMETGTAELPSGSVECPLCKSEFWLEARTHSASLVLDRWWGDSDPQRGVCCGAERGGQGVVPRREEQEPFWRPHVKP
mmetsp:Transcript_64810/g.204638  ORF Transcript_64810/g.204638 Transcript_64810/m.204638 type:complete len:238 (+) Transcript_64810:550-1263(+)